jgi:hypothetical protein
LLPYQITHTLSLFSNVKAGWSEAKHSDLEALLPNDPRPVHDSIVAAVKAGGYEPQSVTSSGER